MENQCNKRAHLKDLAEKLRWRLSFQTLTRGYTTKQPIATQGFPISAQASSVLRRWILLFRLPRTLAGL